MSKDLTLGNETFAYPVQGDKPGWGEDATDWATKATELINEFFGPNDISLTTFTVADNQTSFQNITGLSFNGANSRSTTTSYAVFRTDAATPVVETGIITAVYDDTAWNFNVERVGDAGMAFTITGAGQVQYKSSSVGGTYSGNIKFRTKTIDI